MHECREVPIEEWRKLHGQLNDQIGLLRDDIDELNRSVEVVEQEEGRTRLGISRGEVNQRREFIKKIQASYQTLMSGLEHERQKRQAQSLLPRKTMPIKDPIQSYSEQEDFPLNRSFINEHQALNEVGAIRALYGRSLQYPHITCRLVYHG